MTITSGVVSVSIVAGLLLTNSSVGTQAIIALLLWHGLILALPFMAAVFEAVRRGIEDPMLLALWGAAASGTCAYLSFWCLFFDPASGHFVLLAMLIAAGMVVLNSGVRLTSFQRKACKQIFLPFSLCLIYSAALLIISISSVGPIDQPLEVVRSRFSHVLPVDNALPFLFAKNVLANNFQSPMFADWLGSDRPPLQSGYFLLSTLGLHSPRWIWLQGELSYQVQGTILQSFWIAGLWFLLNSMKLRRTAIIGAVAVCAVSGFALVHGIFVWPKLLPVFHLSLIAGYILSADRAWLSDTRVGALLACNAALALICHGGSFFALAGLGVIALSTWRIPSARFLIVGVLVGIAILLPWSLYQHYFDPPGDRLLKWHLAGVVAIDGRSFSSAFADAYRSMTLKEFFSIRLSQFDALVGSSWLWPWLQVKAIFFQLTASEILQLRNGQFYSLIAALGFFAWVPLMLFLPRFSQDREMAAARKLLMSSALTVAIWVLSMYERGSATIHQGSLAVMVFALAGCFLCCFAWRPAAAWLLLFFQFLICIAVYIFPVDESVIAPSGYLSHVFDYIFVSFLLFIGMFVSLKWSMGEVKCGVP